MITNIIDNVINKALNGLNYTKNTGKPVYASDSGEQYTSRSGDAYDESYYKKLLRERDYDGAVRYLKGFKFVNTDYNAQYQASIASLQQEGARYKALAGKLTDDQLQLYDFMENVYKPEGVDNLLNNKYAKGFENFKDMLGSRVVFTKEGDKNYHEDPYNLSNYTIRARADKLRFYFPKEGKTFDEFLSNSNLTEKDLIDNGIEVKNMNGSYHDKYITFDKSNAISNKLIVDYIEFQQSFTSFPQPNKGRIQGLRENYRGGYDVVDEIYFNENFEPSQEYLDFRNGETSTYEKYYGEYGYDNSKPTYVDAKTALKENHKILKEHKDELVFRSNNGLSNPYSSRGVYNNEIADLIEDSELDFAINRNEILKKYSGYIKTEKSVDSYDEDYALGERGNASGRLEFDIDEKIRFCYNGANLVAGKGAILLKDLEDLKKEESFYKEYTSVLGGNLSDATERLREMHEQGLIDDSTYYKEMALAPKSLVKELKSMDLELEEEAYTNINNKQGDRTLVEANPDDLAELSRRISNAADGDLILQAMVSNGKIGTLITLKSEHRDGDTKKELLDPVQVFVPNLFLDEARNTLNQDTASRSVVEVNNMIDNDGTFTLYDGNMIGANSKGELVMNEYDAKGNLKKSYIIDKNTAVHKVNESLIREGLVDGLIDKYTNGDGTLVYKDAFEQEARIHIMAAADELYPNTPLVDRNGTPFTAEALFHHKIREQDVPAYMWNKIKEIYDLYDTVMTNASLHIR